METGQMNKNKNSNIVNTPYDDVFRTLLNDCRRLIIPVINEIFHENFRGDEEIVFMLETHFLNQQDGGEEKRVTDTSFKIVGDTLKVEIPHSAILFLRCDTSTPDQMRIEMRTPGGTVRFDALVMKSKRYGIDEIFEKNLLFLIPFYIFSHESRFVEYNKDKGKLESLKAEYIDIRNRLDDLLESGQISAYTRKIIMEMSNKVVENLARKYENVREGVKSIMGGRVLEHEAKTILREGWRQGHKEGHEEGCEEGREEGRKEGELGQAKQTAFNLKAMGMDNDSIAKAVAMGVSVVREWFGES